ncbi:amidase [Streptococcus sp. HMSC034B05]|uniref:CHAP domain-containing protein n=1 Tax=Streptococcus sp. HMSC034B05 TaxID=1715022 RepID=UPI0008A14DEC|nr:CHAP domain-containing protein [Streptococcus sp. HMSC034B05]OFN56678.1 amidase [Streptococcus sp. HMSC034B05]
MKKWFNFKIVLFLGSIITSIVVFMMMLTSILGAISSKQDDCSTTETTITSSPTSSGNASIDSFVKEHENAYIESWRVGGFLPSASIAQTMAETSFSMNVPSFASAHNMGGVKWTSAATYPKTIELFGSNAVSSSGSGTTVGDNTGGGYTWFKDFDVGIVGKAEFMSRQSLYKAAINNIDGVGTLNAIADGGWATDPNYKTTLNQIYQNLGSKYKWLDEKAISKYGQKPVNLTESSTNTANSPSTSIFSAEEENPCEDSSDSGSVADGTGTVPADATAWGYQPDNLPASLKPYIIDPKRLGMNYGGTQGWNLTGSGPSLDGQCVNLTISMANIMYGHSGNVLGNGVDQAGAWSRIFGNSVKKKPKKGAIFSNSSIPQYGHTGIVCHVFQDGSVLICEQNTPISGWDSYHKAYTWNYRIVRPETQKAEQWTFAYPDNKAPKLTK